MGVQKGKLNQAQKNYLCGFCNFSDLPAPLLKKIEESDK